MNRRRNAVLAILVGAQVLGVANANLIAVALPSLSADLGASGAEQQWIVDTYVLVLAAMLIPGGVLGDRYGRRRMLLAGLGLFAAGSLACSLAGSTGVLIASRVVQGLGPPLILPASLALVTATFPDPRVRARAIGLWGAGSGIGVAAGPVVGGLIVAGLGWRWTFATNVVLAAALGLAAVALVPRDAPIKVRSRFDWPGAILIALAMASAVFACIEGSEEGVGVVIAGAGAAVVFTVALVFVERPKADPLLDLELLGRRPFLVANLCGATVMFALLPITVYVSLFLQRFRGDSALETGLALLPLGIAVATVAVISGRLAARFVPRYVTGAGLLVATAGALLLSRIGPSDGAGDLWPALLLLGTGAGLALPPSTFISVSTAPPNRTGMASAIHNAGRQLGATFGVAILGSILLARADDGTAAAYCDGLATACLVAAAALALAAIGAISGPRTAAPASP